MRENQIKKIQRWIELTKKEDQLFFILSLHCLERKAIDFNNRYEALIFHN